jgi:hypothetical protein
MSDVCINHVGQKFVVASAAETRFARYPMEDP